MKTRMTRPIWPLLLALLLVFSTTIPGITVQAAVSGDWEYAQQTDGTISITGYRGSESELVIPAQIDGHQVTAIGNRALLDCDFLISVTIPKGVTTIGDSAFTSSSLLTSVTIPEGVTTIEDSAFAECSSLANITIPKSVTTIGDTVFYYCSSLTSVTIPEGVTIIGDGAFQSCKSLASVSLPETVASIGNTAFYQCSALSNVTIPENVLYIGHEAFYGCTSLTSVIIPENVTYIGDRSFDKCSSLTSVTLPKNVTYLGMNAFDFNTLKTIYGEPGSYAETLARAFGLTFVPSEDSKDQYDITGVKITGRAGDALRLTWEKNTDAAGYIIEQYQSGKWVRIAKITSNATTTYRVENLSPSTTYQFRVQAFNFDGNTTLYGNYTYVNGKTNPPATTGVKIGGRAADALRLNWTKNPTAAGYIIEQYQSGKWVRIAKITSNATTTYRVENLSPCTTYQFRIQSFDIDGNTALYSLYTYINGKTNPSAMAGVKIGGWASNALRLNWTKNPTAAGYIIEQYQSGKWVRIARIANNSTTTYRVENLSPGTTYQFRILAFNFDGSTPLYGNYTYVNGKTNPSAVSGVKIGGWAKDALRINWTKNPTAAGYIIEQYQSGKWVRIAKITNNATTTYRVENLSPSTTYQFRIQAFNIDGNTPLYGLYAYVNGQTLK